MKRLINSPLFWWSVLTFSVCGLLTIGVSSFIADLSNHTVLANYLRGALNGTRTLAFINEIGIYATNDAISGVSIGLLSSLIPLSYIYIFRIPEMRKMAIRILTAGYYENFLSGVIDTIHAKGASLESTVLVILPSYDLVDNKIRYWNHFKRSLAKYNFQLETEVSDKEFGRQVMYVYRTDGYRVPIFLDMPTTLTNLKRIIEFEDNSPAGTTSERKWKKQRFRELRTQFRDELSTYVIERDWGNIRFIEGSDLSDFEKELDSVMAELLAGSPAPPIQPDKADSH